MSGLRPAPVAEVRSLIASLLDASRRIDDRLGVITLRAHQVTAAERLLTLIARHGGALLADPVGLGKTYTALAVARELRGSLCVAAPAALREMWRQALADCAMTASFISHESLSRGDRPPLSPEVLIVDESHRLKSAATRRYAVLADVCRNARVLLVSATPLQNRRDDLAVQLALFIGRRAWQMSDEELASHVIRTSDPPDETLPRQIGPLGIALDIEDDCLDQIVALPSPLPARDESVAAALHTYGLVHQWSSSRAALTAALKSRRSRALAMLHSLDAGRLPTRSDLAAWIHHDDAIQLAFPELITSPSDVEFDASALTVTLDRYLAAIEALLRRLRTSPDPDDARAAALHSLRARHPGERIIAFCHYAETVNALWKRLRQFGGAAALTAHGGRVAGGRIARREVVAQFIPRGDRPHVGPAERIDLLLTTDLLSEGLNLQEASVVVHLDLPWNPARLDQRVGRVRRLGSRHEQITVYTLQPPASSERLLRIEQRLRDKLRLAQRTVGVAGQIMPSPISVSVERGLAEQSSAIASRIRSWRSDRTAPCGSVATVIAECAGFLAVVREGAEVFLLGDIGTGPSESNTVIERAVELSNGPHCHPDDCHPDDCHPECNACPREAGEGSAFHALENYLNTRRGSRAIDFTVAAATKHRRATLARVAQTLARTPRHLRARLAPLAEAARAVATSTLGEGAERVLESLSRAELPDEAWLRSVATFGALNARDRAEVPSAPAETGRIAALIVFHPVAASVRSRPDDN